MSVQTRLDGTSAPRAAIARSTARARFVPSAAGSTLVASDAADRRRRLAQRRVDAPRRISSAGASEPRSRQRARNAAGSATRAWRPDQR